MNMDPHYTYTPYIWPMLAPAVFTAALVIFVWRQRSVPGALPLALAMLFTIPWAVGAALEVAAVDVSTKIFWVKFQAIWTLPVNTAVLCFVLEYANPSRWFLLAPLVGFDFLHQLGQRLAGILLPFLETFLHRLGALGHADQIGIFAGVFSRFLDALH
jgi:N-terminal 7TM region of histidine kinase